MKLSVKILKWIFLGYAIFIPTVTILISLGGVWKGLHLIMLPFIVAFFVVLYWWDKNLLLYHMTRQNSVSGWEKAFVWLQALLKYALVIVPLLILTAFISWNIFERYNPLEKPALYSYLFLKGGGLAWIVAGTIMGTFYHFRLKSSAE